MGAVVDYIERVISYFEQLPGIGPKSARRIVFYLLQQDKKWLKEFALQVANLKEGLLICSFCNMYSYTDPCEICADELRDSTKLLIVRSFLHRLAVENTKVHKGYYFLLEFDQHKSLQELFEDTGFKENIKLLMKRIRGLKKNIGKGEKLELIFGFGGTFNEEAVISYVKDKVSNTFGSNVVFSRFALGIQPGADIDFVDAYTLEQTYQGRQKVS